GGQTLLPGRDGRIDAAPDDHARRRPGRRPLRRPGRPTRRRGDRRGSDRRGGPRRRGRRRPVSGPGPVLTGRHPASAHRPGPGRLDGVSARIYVNGRIHSPASPDATAMAVEGDTVVWLGADRPGLALHPDAEVIDLDGAFLAPAFVDPHVHLTDTGLAATGLDLSAVTGAQELLDILARHAES